MRNYHACSSVFLRTPSWIRQEFALLILTREFAVKGSSTSSARSDGGRKGRTQDLLDALSPTEKITSSESELEEAAKRYVALSVTLYASSLAFNGSITVQKTYMHILISMPCRAKEYSRQKMKEHRQWQAAFMTKVKLRDAAVAALPESLREEAMKPDLSLFPSTRQVWMETPPHEHKDMKQVQYDDTDKRKQKIGTKV